MADGCVIGIDVGTSGCKAILVDCAGAVVGSDLQEYPLSTPRPGWSEQDPADWWEAAQAGLRRLIEASGVAPDAVLGIGLSGQMHGLVAMDGDGRVLRPAILWNDQRTAPQCEEIHAAAGGVPELLKLTNNRMLPGYTGGKIVWLREEEPLLYEKARRFLNPKDYIRWRLTGEMVTEVSDASGTGLFNVRERRWSDELLDKLDIPRERLPECVESPEVTGGLTAEAAAATGLPAGLPVVGGGGDAVIQTTGMGLIGPGTVGTIIGTSGIVAAGLDAFHENPGGRLQVFCNNSPGAWHVMGVTLAAGGSYRWYRDALCERQKELAARAGKDAYELLEDYAAQAPAGSRGLVFLPYMIGERCPYADPNARGCFVGLSLQHGRAEMTRAVMEGVIFSLRDVYELIREMEPAIAEIRTSGGGSRSPLWRQIQADVFQCRVVTVSASGEGAAYGAALVAGAGVGVWGSVEEAIGVLDIETETEPDPANKQLYADLYGVYHELYGALKPSFDALAATQQ